MDNLSAFKDWSPEKSSILFKDFVLWDQTYSGLRRMSLERFTGGKDRRLTRLILNNPEDSMERILIDFYENPSTQDATEYLRYIIANDQLSDLPAGPDELGESFIHPDDEPPAVFWARGNYCVVLNSFGKKRVSVIELALIINLMLLHMPQADERLFEMDNLKPGERAEIDFFMPRQLGEGGYYKFFASGGDLFLEDGKVYFRAGSEGEAIVRAFALEPNRKPQSVRANLIIE